MELLFRGRAKVLLAAFVVVFFWKQLNFAQCSGGFINVQGRVVDANGRPVRKVDLDFFHIPTGIKLITPGDNTDSLGFYNVCIFPPAFYRITFEPLYPFNTNLVGKETLNVDLTASRVLPDIRLEFGWAVAGRATDTAGKPIDSVNLAVDDWISKKRLFTPGDKTDSLGNYRIVIPNGSYRFRYAPAPGRRQVGVQLDTVKINGRDTTINVTIHTGFFVSASIIDTTFNPLGTPIRGADLDMEDTLGNKLFLPRNTSDSLGKLTVVAPGNLYDLLFVPPRDSHVVAKKVRAFALATDTIVTQALNHGVLLTVRVVDSLNQPVPFADLDVIREFPTRNEMFTPTDNADQFGVIKVAVPPDSYTVVVNPPAGAANFDTLILPGLVKLLNDFDTTVILPGHPIRISPPGEERILDAYPNPFRPAANSFIYFPVDLTALSGNWKVSLTIFTPAGEIVFKDEKELSGSQMNRRELFWNGHNDDNEPAASGVYFCKIILREAGGSQQLEKVLKTALIR